MVALWKQTGTEFSPLCLCLTKWQKARKMQEWLSFTKDGKSIKNVPIGVFCCCKTDSCNIEINWKIFSISFILCVLYGRDTAKHVDALRCSFTDPAEIFLEWSVIIKHSEDEKMETYHDWLGIPLNYVVSCQTKKTKYIEIQTQTEFQSFP